MSIIEIPSQTNQILHHEATNGRSFFNATNSSDEIMYQQSVDMEQNVQDLLPSGSVDIKAYKEDGSSPLTIVTGQPKDHINHWSWTYYFDEAKDPNYLVCDVAYDDAIITGEGSSSKSESRIPTFQLEHDDQFGIIGRPIVALSGLTVAWHYLKSNLQGQLYRQGLISDEEGILSAFTESVIAKARISKWREYLKAEKDYAKNEHALNPMTYFSHDIIPVKAVGFAGCLGLKNTAYSVPLIYIDSKTKGERVISSGNLPHQINEVLSDKNLVFETKATILDHDKPTRTKMIENSFRNYASLIPMQC